MNTFKKRLLATACMLVFGFSAAIAQTSTIKHTVDRGETLHSIAKRYATTEAKIIELNPDAAQFVYVGMELVIPNAQEYKQTNTSVEDVNPSNSAMPSATDGMFVQTISNEYSVSDFAFYGFSYFAPFKGAGKGYYMVGGEFFSDSGWGGDLQIGLNYGLVDKDYAGCAFLVGPAYGHPFNMILVSASLDFLGTYSNTGTSLKTGTNGKGEEYTYLGTDSKFNWGIALMPKVAIKLGKVTPWLGVNALWGKGADKLSFGFQVGIGFNI